MSIGFTEILLILFVVLILFGAKRLPELARSIGKAVSEFKKGMSEIKGDLADSGETGPKADAKNMKSAKKKTDI